MNKKASFLFEIEQLVQKAFDKKALDKEGFLYLQSFLDSHKLICSELLFEDKNPVYTPRIKRHIEKIKLLLSEGINNSDKFSVKLLKLLPNYKVIDTNSIMTHFNDLSLYIIEDLIKANDVNKKRKSYSGDVDEISPNKRLQQNGNSYRKIGSSYSTDNKNRDAGLISNGHDASQNASNQVSRSLSVDLEYFIAKENDSTKKIGNADYGTLETDAPSKIIGHTLSEQQDPVSGNIKLLAFQIEWAPRKDGFRPISSYYAYEKVKESYSNLILQYFENVIQLE